MKILICGDLIARFPVEKPASEVFGDFMPIIKEADYSFYNQEHPLTESKYIYPTKRYGTTHNCSPQLASVMAQAGFTHATLATNHMLNRGVSGIRDTINNLKKVGIGCVGAGETLDEAKKVLRLEKDGIAVAVINVAENEFCTANRHHGGSNPFDVITIAEKIWEAKESANSVVVIVHGGVEYFPYPRPLQVKASRFFVDCGASVVIWHHTHYAAGFEHYKNGDIFYGLGNFLPIKHVSSFADDQYANITLAVMMEFQVGVAHCCNARVFKFDRNKGCLIEFRGEDRERFDERMKKVNTIIGNAQKLEDVFCRDFLTPDQIGKLGMIFSTGSNFIRRCCRKVGLLKIWGIVESRKLSISRKNFALWDCLRCETHQDVFRMVYDNFVDLYRNDEVTNG